MSQEPVKKHTVTCLGRRMTLPALDGDRREKRLLRRLERGEWEPETYRAIDEFVDAQTDYIDIGAWIGATAFWAAQRARRVIAVEPDPVSAQRLGAVLPDNGDNITLVRAALSDQPSVTLHAKREFGGSSTSAITGDMSKSVEVDGVTLADLVARCEGPVFIKIDIEGLEYRLRDMIFADASEKIRAVQLAVHPHLYARSLAGGGGIAKRLGVFRETLRLFAAAEGYRVRRPRRLRLTAVRKILLRRKPTGWDVLYERV